MMTVETVDEYFRIFAPLNSDFAVFNFKCSTYA